MIKRLGDWVLTLVLTALLGYYVLIPLFGDRPHVPIYSPEYLGAVALSGVLWGSSRWLWRRWRRPSEEIWPPEKRQ